MKRIDCDTRDQMLRIFEPWTTQLYTVLEAAHTNGNAPDEEPSFSPFPQIDCNPDGTETLEAKQHN